MAYVVVGETNHDQGKSVKDKKKKKKEAGTRGSIITCWVTVEVPVPDLFPALSRLQRDIEGAWESLHVGSLSPSQHPFLPAGSEAWVLGWNPGRWQGGSLNSSPSLSAFSDSGVAEGGPTPCQPCPATLQIGPPATGEDGRLIRGGECRQPPGAEG